MHLGTGVRVVATEKNYTQGSLHQTGNSLDVAINGRGFFQVLMPDGSFGYTRDGSFQMSAGRAGHLERLPVQPGISIPDGAQSITIGTRRHGQRAASPARPRPTQVGTLQLADFVNPAGLQPRGENLLSESAASGPAADQHARPQRPGHAVSRARWKAPTSTWSRSW